MRVAASAPGKVTLFGEHAVVYGHPAIVAALDKRVYAYAEPRSDDVVKISAKDLRVPGLIVSYVGGELVLETDYGAVLPAIAYVSKAVEVAARYLDVRKGVNVEIRSEMPVGAGLGTSAAVAAATITAFAAAHGYELAGEEVANLAWEVEKGVQGIASPMDSSITALGGYLKISYGSGGAIERVALKVPKEPLLVVGYVERVARTKEMVELVRARLFENPDLYGEILRLIGRLAVEAEKALLRGDLRTLGSLMNVNHALLDALGVSTRRLNELVQVAREAGAYGAKLTGAGGGGCVIALAPENADAVEVAMRLHGSMVFRARLGAEGVRVEAL